MLEHLGWTELLHRWSEEVIAHADAIALAVTAEMRSSGWIGFPPAPTADIAAAQARLGRSLPRSYRAFLAITNGWPVLSFAFGQVRPVAELDWVAAADPGLYEVVCADYGYEWPPDGDDGPPLMSRCLLLSSGHSSDNFLYDTGRPGADGEWATTCWTSWYPGAGDRQPSFRAGLESHYASFARAGRDAEAFEAILSALPSWRPLSPLHLAPLGLTWDRDLGRIMTRERRERLLATARGSG
jgi:hypothetical protein